MTASDVSGVAGAAPVVLRSTDAAALAAVHRDCFGGDPALGEAWDAGAMQEILGMSGTIALVAAHGDKVHGMVIVRIAADEAEILTVGVVEAARRRGVGTELLRAALATAGAAGARRMALEVAEANAAAIALYRGQGFVEKGYRRGYYNVRATGVSAVSALILVRDLKP